MQFTNPSALWLLALVPLPLMLTRRRTPVRRAVSALFLWQAAVHPAGEGLARRWRHQRWRTAAQMACIAAIAIALSGPLLTMRGGTTVLVFDVSASMAALDAGTTRLQAAQSQARGLVQGLPVSTPVRVIAAASAARDIGEWSAADPRLGAAVDALVPTGGRADLGAAIDFGARVGGVDTIVVFSDAAAAAGRSSAAARPAVQWIRVGRPGPNAAVTRIVARPFAHGERAGQVLVALRNFGSTSRDADVDVSVDGRPVHRTTVRLPAGREHSLYVPLADLGRVVTARIAGGDALSIDDVGSVSVPRPVRVALAGPAGSFLHRALDVNPAVALKRFDGRTDAATLDRAWSSGEADVVVCDRCTDPAVMAPALIVIPPAAHPQRAPVVLSNATHPIAASLEPGDESATAGDGPALPPGSDVILRVAGVPAAVAIEREGRRRVELRFDLSQHDFALTPAFPVLVANAVEWLSGQGQPPPQATSGEPLAIARRGVATSTVHAVGPDGRSRDLRHVGDQSILLDTDMPGHYRIDVAGSEHLVVVNPAVDTESDLSSSTVAVDERVLGAASAAGEVAIAPWLALMALALMAVDWRFRLVRTS
jgi:hypothetical protein